MSVCSAQMVFARMVAQNPQLIHVHWELIARIAAFERCPLQVPHPRRSPRKRPGAFARIRANGSRICALMRHGISSTTTVIFILSTFVRSNSQLSQPCNISVCALAESEFQLFLSHTAPEMGSARMPWQLMKATEYLFWVLIAPTVACVPSQHHSLWMAFARMAESPSIHCHLQARAMEIAMSIRLEILRAKTLPFTRHHRQPLVQARPQKQHFCCSRHLQMQCRRHHLQMQFCHHSEV